MCRSRNASDCAGGVDADASPVVLFVVEMLLPISGCVGLPLMVRVLANKYLLLSDGAT